MLAAERERGGEREQRERGSKEREGAKRGSKEGAAGCSHVDVFAAPELGPHLVANDARAAEVREAEAGAALGHARHG